MLAGAPRQKGYGLVIENFCPCAFYLFIRAH